MPTRFVCRVKENPFSPFSPQRVCVLIQHISRSRGWFLHSPQVNPPFRGTTTRTLEHPIYTLIFLLLEVITAWSLDVSSKTLAPPFSRAEGVILILISSWEALYDEVLCWYVLVDCFAGLRRRFMRYWEDKILSQSLGGIIMEIGVD